MAKWDVSTPRLGSCGQAAAAAMEGSRGRHPLLAAAAAGAAQQTCQTVSGDQQPRWQQQADDGRPLQPPPRLLLQERDPRWLVQPREDGKNVNGWHWEEKNRLIWCRERLQQLLPAILPADAGGLRITEVSNVTGEVRCSLATRSAQLAVGINA